MSDKVNLVISHLTHVIENMRQSSLHLKEASLDNQSTSGSLREAMLDQNQSNRNGGNGVMEQIECSVTEITPRPTKH